MIQKRNLKAVGLYILVALILDQVTKLFAVNYLRPFDPPTELIGSVLRLKLTFNPFGVFGISVGSNELYYVLSVVGLIVLGYIALTVKDRIGVVVFGLLIGGALGNLLDRIRFGYVIDFIDMGIGNVRWFTYNLADAFITVGAIFLLLREFLRKKTAE